MSNNLAGEIGLTGGCWLVVPRWDIGAAGVDVNWTGVNVNCAGVDLVLWRWWGCGLCRCGCKSWGGEDVDCGGADENCAGVGDVDCAGEDVCWNGSSGLWGPCVQSSSISSSGCSPCCLQSLNASNIKWSCWNFGRDLLLLTSTNSTSLKATKKVCLPLLPSWVYVSLCIKKCSRPRWKKHKI